MGSGDFDVVTGAFGFTGRYIARELLARGRSVRTLTNRSPDGNPLGASITTAPLNFEKPTELAASLAGARTLYNTYWVRFSHGGTTFERAIENTQTLIRAAVQAGIQRVVHISITNPSADSPLPYFRGKALVEQLIADSGLSYAIVRPAVLFGNEGILINNIAWFLRRLPVFVIPGAGEFRLQPVFVEDLARIAVEAGESKDNRIIDAVGPEAFPYIDLVGLVSRTVGSRTWLLRAPAWMTLLGARVTGWAVGDVVMTRDELTGLMGNLLVSNGPPTGRTRLSDWLAEHAATLGRVYASELQRHFRTPAR